MKDLVINDISKIECGEYKPNAYLPIFYKDENGIEYKHILNSSLEDFDEFSFKSSLENIERKYMNSHSNGEFFYCNKAPYFMHEKGKAHLLENSYSIWVRKDDSLIDEEIRTLYRSIK